MQTFENDSRVVLTLDAGGTNFQFSAIKGNKLLLPPLRFEPHSDDLDKCIQTIIEGFESVIAQLEEAPVAISFAFPGPADYPNGIIGDLPNLPAFIGGVPLRAILENHFQLPVFINNDGNLFAYGEALCGLLPLINKDLETAENPKRYRNLIGITLGTGFGVGIVCNGQLIIGDNSNGGEGWLFRNLLNPEANVEKHLSREGIRHIYASKSKQPLDQVGDPSDIYKIAKGMQTGNREAAMDTFKEFGTVLGEAIANLLNVIDGLVVLGGGVSGAYDLFAPALFAQLDSCYQQSDGEQFKRLMGAAYNLEEAEGKKQFLENNSVKLQIPNTGQAVLYNSKPKTGIALSESGATQMIALGAYAFALMQLNNR